ncbi:MAG: nucleotidyltransferase domain-containing protein [Bacteroidaceae bacterium]|nr:nucleotidyltransferase domain-containing protein [Bacteroidaceae bacterium]
MKQQVIDSIKQTLAKHLPVGGQALLFGSQARGEAHSESDWDILIILNKDKLLPGDYDNVTYPLTELGWDLGERINPIMYTAKEWEDSRITPFYQNVNKDAIVLA